MTSFDAAGPTPVLDDDLAAPSDLDDLRDSLAAELTADVEATTDVEVLGRPGYAVRARLDFTGRELDQLRKSSKNKRFLDGIDGIRFASLVVASFTVAIVRRGDLLDLGTGGPVTFTTPELHEVLGTSDADSSVRKLFGREGHIDAAARRIMDEAGWGDEAYTVDPTR